MIFISCSVNANQSAVFEAWCRTAVEDLKLNAYSSFGWKSFDDKTGASLLTGVNYFGFQVPLFAIENARMELFDLTAPNIIFNKDFKYLQMLRVIKQGNLKIGVAGAGIAEEERVTDLLRESFSYKPDNIDCSIFNKRTSTDQYLKVTRMVSLLTLKAASTPKSSLYAIDLGEMSGYIIVLQNGFIHHWENDSARFSYTLVLEEKKRINLDKYVSDYVVSLQHNNILISKPPTYETIMAEWQISGENNWEEVLKKLKQHEGNEKLIKKITYFINKDD